ncbi:MAG: hypothetical protein AAGJ37_15485 [Pseudomonadota bacterium]
MSWFIVSASLLWSIAFLYVLREKNERRERIVATLTSQGALPGFFGNVPNSIYWLMCFLPFPILLFVSMSGALLIWLAALFTVGWVVALRR